VLNNKPVKLWVENSVPISHSKGSWRGEEGKGGARRGKYTPTSPLLVPAADCFLYTSILRMEAVHYSETLVSTGEQWSCGHEAPAVWVSTELTWSVSVCTVVRGRDKGGGGALISCHNRGQSAQQIHSSPVALKQPVISQMASGLNFSIVHKVSRLSL
jgi:hypothetical protein